MPSIKDMRKISAVPTAPPTEYGSDGLVNRDPDLDSFTRPISDQAIQYGVRPKIVEEVKFSTAYKYDNLIRSAMYLKPDLSVLVNSLVFLRVQRRLNDGSLEYGEGSGVRVSLKTIFTCAHVIGDSEGTVIMKIDVYTNAQDMKRNEGGLDAEHIPLDPDLMALYNYPGNATNDQFWSGQDPDFAVLRIRDLNNNEHEGRLLSVPKQFDLPNPRLYDGEVLCMAGLPQPPSNSTLCLRSSLILAIQMQHPKAWEEVAAKIVRNGCFEFNDPVASFGAVQRIESDIGQMYVCSSASTMNGMSGGPVVNLANPTQLLGLVVAGATQGFHTVFFRADSPIVVEAFKRYGNAKPAA